MSHPTTTLRNIFSASGKSRAGDQDLPILSITMKHGLVDQSEKFKKRVASSNTKSYRIALRNELVVGFPIDEGVIGFQTKYRAGIVSPAYNIWKLKSPDRTHIPYLERYLRSDQARHLYASRMQGAVARRRNLTKEDFLDLEIPLPGVGEQRRIAAVLGKMEGLITQRKQHLQQLDDLLKSVFLDMFGDPVRNEWGWESPNFKTIIFGMRNGLSPSKEGDKQGRVYTLSAITGSRFQEIYKEDSFSQIPDKYFPNSNDFFVCRGNGNIKLVGKGYFFPGVSKDVIFPDTIIAVSIQPHTVNKHFFEHLWKTRFIRRQIETNARTTNGTYKINQSVINDIKIIRPPSELQNQFAFIVEKVEHIKFCFRQSLTNLETLYAALSQKAFKGELDLSRIPLPQVIQPEPIEEGAAVSVDVDVEQESAPGLPDFADLAETTGRAVLLRRWLDEELGQGAKQALDVQGFLEQAQARIAGAYPDEEETPLTMDDYETVKQWVFEQLEQGRLSQTLDEEVNRVTVTGALG